MDQVGHGLDLVRRRHHQHVGHAQQQRHGRERGQGVPLYSLSRRQEFCMNLLKQLSLDNLINMVDYQDAPSAYEHVDQHPEDVIQIVFRYDS